MKLDWLADELRKAGVDVVEHAGWKTRTNYPFDRYTPIGLINHHTAGSAVLTDYPNKPFYRNAALENKCNLTIRPDGVVVVLNAGWAADSGYGAPEVLDAVRNDRALPPLGDLKSTVNGNKWFVDIEVQHLGNGDPIHPPQRQALIATNAAICRRMGWDPMFRLIGHREWAPDRKVDPRWDGKHTNPMPLIRSDTRMEMEEEMVTRKTTVDPNPKLAKNHEKAVEVGVYSEHTQPGGLIFADELATFFARAGILQKKGARTWTRAEIAAIASAAAGGGAAVALTAEQIIDAIRQALGG